MWVQVAGALAEAGVGLEEITDRVSEVAKAMGECRPRAQGGGGGGRGPPWTGSRFLAAAQEASQVTPQGLREGLPAGAPENSSLGSPSQVSLPSLR